MKNVNPGAERTLDWQVETLNLGEHGSIKRKRKISNVEARNVVQ